MQGIKYRWKRMEESKGKGGREESEGKRKGGKEWGTKEG